MDPRFHIIVRLFHKFYNDNCTQLALKALGSILLMLLVSCSVQFIYLWSPYLEMEKVLCSHGGDTLTMIRANTALANPTPKPSQWWLQNTNQIQGKVKKNLLKLNSVTPWHGDSGKVLPCCVCLSCPKRRNKSLQFTVTEIRLPSPPLFINKSLLSVWWVFRYC